MIQKQIFTFLLLLSATLSFAQDSGIQKKLIGSWIYNGLEYPESLDLTDKVKLEKADMDNRNLILTFSNDGKYVVWNKTKGKDRPFAKGILKLTNKGRHLKIDGLEGDIVTIDQEFLTLSHPDRPNMKFKRYTP
ncbi:hypothetical protein [Paraflavitalea sp. CAU 1676]|uniref:hypothetical protein n=1 Tax=Paraflavitalea sp. CAU 1676 TaxID=3032598 RepID=UPI0023DA8855|nr:hypothetical protein [Paraflavitalea sp. CAU 1676]MDF2188410.1 hypothetical protein [Paraflavitalea sp. CAU 1676]